MFVDSGDMDATSVIKILESHDISAGECAGYSAAAGDIGTAINAALCGEDGKVCYCCILALFDF